MRIFLTFLFSCLLLPCTAQKAYKEVKASLKAKKYKEALSQTDKLRKDSLYKNDPKLCHFSIEANKGLNDAENTKLYLKKSYDTLTFFSTTHQIVEECVRLHQLQSQKTDSLTKFAYKDFRFVKEQLQQYYPNLSAAARYFYKKQKYEEAMKYLRCSIDLQNSELGQAVQLSPKPKNNATVYLASAYFAKNYAEVFRYEDQALCDTAFRPTTIEYLACSAKELADTIRYKQYLQKGWAEYPDNHFFFTHLADYYTKQADYTTLLGIAQKQKEQGHTLSSALFAETLAHFNLQQYDSCIVDARSLIQSDTSNVEAHYYIGASYVAKASMVNFPEKVTTGTIYRRALKKQHEFYELAEPELETFRALRPNESQLWASLLYKVYFSLNRGKKFEEIEKMLISTRSSAQ